MMIPVILSGGSGTRLWPVSRAKLPKQFCRIFDEPLFTKTLKRTLPLGKPIVVTGKNLSVLTEICLQQTDVSDATVLLEPIAKNTAAAVALVCRLLELRGQHEEVIGIFPADHLIKNQASFLETMKRAEKVAKQNVVVTLGIAPSHPETGYGYIQIEKPKGIAAHQDSFSVFKFHEKPNMDKAKEFLEKGGYFWNAGIFVFKVQKMIDLFQRLTPSLWNEVVEVKGDGQKISCEEIRRVYQKLPSISIDYAILERLGETELSCIPCDIGWDDVGSWDSVSHVAGINSEARMGAAAIDLDNPIAEGRVFEVAGHHNYTHGVPDKTYTFCGVNDLIVVDTADALLISRKGQSQQVREVVEVLKKENPKILDEHTYDERPWGRFDVLRDTEHFKSKILNIYVGEQISYQSHSQREEHWIVTKGMGEVILNDAIQTVRAGSYVKIPKGAKHRVRNSGSEVLEIVEVQLGSYFGEDDIVRYQDDYNRT